MNNTLVQNCSLLVSIVSEQCRGQTKNKLSPGFATFDTEKLFNNFRSQFLNTVVVTDFVI